MTEQFTTTNVGKEHVETMSIFVAPQKRHNKWMADFTEIKMQSNAQISSKYG